MAEGDEAQKEDQNSDEQGNGEERELLTLTEVSERTGISMPTLQRYKKNHQDRLPTVGEGRTQRYPVESLEVFKQIKKENIAKRGRPKKKRKDGESKAAARRRRRRQRKKKTKAPKRTEDGRELLTLTKVEELTGISYPTLVRYVKEHRDRIPYEGEGRRKRYHPEAVEVFNQIRSESKRGRKKKSGEPKAAKKAATDGSVSRRLKALEKSHADLEKQVRELIKLIKKPMTVTVQRK